MNLKETQDLKQFTKIVMSYELWQSPDAVIS